VTGTTIARAVAALATTGIVVGGWAGGLSCATTLVDGGLDGLAQRAGSDPAARAGVAALAESAHTLVNTSGSYAPFLYASPTKGCGDGSGPFVFTAATGLGSDGTPGSIRFQAAPAYSGVPTSSALRIAWINVDSGANGIVAVDGVTADNLPSLSKTVPTGPGTVVASIWGAVSYTDAICAITPTVGEFTVGPLPDSA
jgi:hypothetical protein